MKVPVNTPLFSGNEKKYLNECIDTGWISSEGPFINRFEESFAEYVNRNFGIAVSNGSAALDIAIKALGLSDGDEVIVPNFTIISPVFSIIRSGAIPVLIDSDIDTWNMDCSRIEEKITSRTKAILVVHIYGLPVDMDKILDLARKYNLYIIEDAAEVHGLEYNGKKCGSFGTISTFSFYPNKHITTGEGGMILTDDLELNNKCKELRNLSFLSNGPRFIHHDIGWNYRMTNMQAALGLAQLENIDKHISIKRQIGNKYFDSFNGIKGLKFQSLEPPYSENIFWVFGVLCDTSNLKNYLVSQLDIHGIGTRPFFYPMNKQPVLLKAGYFSDINDGSYHVSSKLGENGFYLPSGLGLTEIQQDYVIKTVLKIVSNYNG